MSRTGLSVAAVGLVLASCLLVVGSRPTASQDITRVIVTNWPATQTIDGTVGIEGPVRLADHVAFREVLVPPVAPTDTTRLVSAGELVPGGFAHVVLSLHGQVKGSVGRSGEVGAILLPQEESVEAAFEELGLIHFPLNVAATVSSGTPYFASPQPSHIVGFPKYEVLLYNTTDKTVTIDLFAYLTN